MITTTFYGEVVGERARDQLTPALWLKHVMEGPLGVRFRTGPVRVMYPRNIPYLGVLW